MKNLVHGVFTITAWNIFQNHPFSAFLGLKTYRRSFGTKRTIRSEQIFKNKVLAVELLGYVYMSRTSLQIFFIHFRVGGDCAYFFPPCYKLFNIMVICFSHCFHITLFEIKMPHISSNRLV